MSFPDVRLTQLEFWEAFAAYLDEANTSLSSREARPQNWYSLSIGTSRAYVSCTVSVNERTVSCELYLPGRFGADAIFRALHAQTRGHRAGVRRRAGLPRAARSQGVSHRAVPRR